MDPFPDIPVDLPLLPSVVVPLPQTPPLTLPETLVVLRAMQKTLKSYNKHLSDFRDCVLEFEQKSLQLTKCNRLLLQNKDQVDMVLQLRDRYPDWVFQAQIHDPLLGAYARQNRIELAPN